MEKKTPKKEEDLSKDLQEIKELLKQTNEYLKLLVDFEETRKRIHPSSEEIFGTK